MTQRARVHIAVDAIAIIASIILAVYLVQSGIIERAVGAAGAVEIFGSFIAGLFFTSIFTTVPAMAVLGTIAQNEPVFLVALLGGFGAMCGDFLIFKFIRDRMAEDIRYLVSAERGKKLRHLLHLRLFRWFVPFLGALVIASPLPDELGIAMLGLSKTNTKIFFAVSFLANTTGILLIGLAARSLL